MTIMQKTHLAIGAAVLVMLLSVGYVIRERRHTEAIADKAAKLDEFCFATRDAFRQDRLAFESGDLRKQEEAYGRFYNSEVMFHSYTSFMMCSDDLPKVPLGCDLNKDWNCLARIAREMETKIPRYHSN